MAFNLISVILAFGILQGLISASLILSSKFRDSLHNRILAFLVIALSLTITPTLLGQLELTNTHGFLIFLPIDFSLFLLPLLYIYISSVFTQHLSFKVLWPHLLPAFFFSIYFFIAWLMTLSVDEKGSIAIKAFYFEIQLASQVVWTIMLFYYAYASNQLIGRFNSTRLTRSQLTFIPWVKSLLVVFVVLGFIELSSLILGKYYGYWRGSPVDLWLGVSLSMVIKCSYAILLYLIAYIGFAKFRKLSISAPRITSSDVKNYVKKLTDLMEVEEQYLNPNLTLTDLSVALNTSSVYLSFLLNNELHISFNDFVNRYRVEAIKVKLASEAADKYTLLAIAEESGFKSKTTFYRAFQKFTNQTPTEYLSQSKEQ